MAHLWRNFGAKIDFWRNFGVKMCRIAPKCRDKSLHLTDWRASFIIATSRSTHHTSPQKQWPFDLIYTYGMVAAPKLSKRRKKMPIGTSEVDLSFWTLWRILAQFWRNFGAKIHFWRNYGAIFAQFWRKNKQGGHSSICQYPSQNEK